MGAGMGSVQVAGSWAAQVAVVPVCGDPACEQHLTAQAATSIQTSDYRVTQWSYSPSPVLVSSFVPICAVHSATEHGVSAKLG